MWLHRVKAMRKRGKRRRGKRKKVEFSKFHVLFANALVAFVFVTNAILSLLDKMPLSDLSVAIVTIYGGFATSGYFALNGIRDLSLNKHRLRIVEDENGKQVIEAIPHETTETGGLES